jgi:hypothetical protein
MFHCKVCDEKDKHIASLLSQIARLEKLLFVPTTSDKLPTVQLEADKVMSGSHEPLEQTAEEIDIEAANILSGSYS